ncbi:MAG: hypothetical protein V9E94_19515 [Microthrixaceae bacterium]
MKSEAVEKSEPVKLDAVVDGNARQLRQMNELVAHTQRILHLSFKTRDKLWAGADRSSVEKWTASAEKYRALVWDELIGRLPHKPIAPSPRTRKILETPEYHGYEVVLDVHDDVIAAGILLLPSDLKAGDKRPVVVCQHGLEGVPMDTISGPGSAGHPYYKGFAAEFGQTRVHHLRRRRIRIAESDQVPHPATQVEPARTIALQLHSCRSIRRRSTG